MERYIIEVVDGRFLFTDLLNYASPLIRYENQDIGEFGEECQCGRGLITIKPLVGRVLSYLQNKNGNWISGFIIYLPVMYYDSKYGTDLFKWVESYQIRQREQGKISVLLKSWEHARPPEDLSEQLKVLKKYAKDFDVLIEVVDKIPKSSTGKQLAVDTTLRRLE
jgi:phenylacetate-CoA ligase